jgi:hypothetical protein
MVDTQELIDKISSGNMADASKAFTELMGAKVQDALDDRKVELGQFMNLSPEEVEEIKAQEADLEDDDFEDDDLEASEEDEEDSDEVEEEDEEDEDLQSAETES